MLYQYEKLIDLFLSALLNA